MYGPPDIGSDEIASGRHPEIFPEGSPEYFWTAFRKVFFYMNYV